MASFDWPELLTEWNQELLKCSKVVDALPPEIVRAGWLGSPSATERQIQETEARLDVALPPSYREFLAVTNGWLTTGNWVGKVWSATEVEWYRVRHQEDAIDAWLTGASEGGVPYPVPDDEYFIYGEKQDTASVRLEYLQTSLELTEESGTEVYLLNPQIVTPEGEWEAWFLAHWLPGARRYRSFWDLMHGEYRSFLAARGYRC